MTPRIETAFQTLPDDKLSQYMLLALVRIVWDTCFGTFSAELDEDPFVCGLKKKLGTFTPRTVLAHGHAEPFRNMLRTGSVRKAHRSLLDAAGWSHDGVRTSARRRSGQRSACERG